MIETERLKLYAASKEQMEAFIAAQTSEEMKAAYTQMLEGSLACPEGREWYAVWMIERGDGTHVGEFCFKGVGGDGSTEIGYGIADGFRGRGYATEAVRAAAAWALGQDGIRCVTAEADSGNAASIRVPEKAGFKRTGRVGEEGPIFCRTKE